MSVFYCVGCRKAVVASRLGRLVAAAHLHGTPAGFCLVCLPQFLPELATAVDGYAPDSALSA